MKTIIVMLDVSCNDEYADIPETFIGSFEVEEVLRMKKLAEEIKKISAGNVPQIDYYLPFSGGFTGYITEKLEKRKESGKHLLLDETEVDIYNEVEANLTSVDYEHAVIWLSDTNSFAIRAFLDSNSDDEIYTEDIPFSIFEDQPSMIVEEAYSLT